MNEIVADYVFNMTCPAHTTSTTGYKPKKDDHKQRPVSNNRYIVVLINNRFGSPQTMCNDDKANYDVVGAVIV